VAIEHRTPPGWREAKANLEKLWVRQKAKPFAVGVLFIAEKWNWGRPSWTAAPVNLIGE
jgi:hypothetical protein